MPASAPSRALSSKGWGATARALYHTDTSWRMACEIFLIGLLTMLFASGPKTTSAQAPTTYQRPSSATPSPPVAPQPAVPPPESSLPPQRAAAPVQRKPLTVTSQQLRNANLPPNAEVMGGIEIKPTRSLQDVEVMGNNKDDEFGVFKYGNGNKSLKPSDR